MTISSLLGVLFLLLFAAFGIYLEYCLVLRYRDREQKNRDKLFMLLGSIDQSLIDIAYHLHGSSDS